MKLKQILFQPFEIISKAYNSKIRKYVAFASLRKEGPHSRSEILCRYSFSPTFVDTGQPKDIITSLGMNVVNACPLSHPDGKEEDRNP